MCLAAPLLPHPGNRLGSKAVELVLYSLHQLSQLTTLALDGQFTCYPSLIYGGALAPADSPYPLCDLAGDTFSGNTPPLTSLQAPTSQVQTLSIGGELTACVLRQARDSTVLIKLPQQLSWIQSR